MKAQAKPYERGARMTGETLTYIPAEFNIRPIKDNIVLHLREEMRSRYIIMEFSSPPLEGEVLAVGPGAYPKRYDHPDKHKRTKTWDSKAFLRTEVKVGDTVKLGDGEISNSSFQRFWWGDKLCCIVTERDVAGIVDQRATPRRAPLHQRQLPRVSARNR